MWDLVYGRADPTTVLEMRENDTRNNQTIESATHGLWHISHCFDILRQSLMCSADMSIEGPAVVDGKHMFNGLGNVHECKNWDAIWEFLEAHTWFCWSFIMYRLVLFLVTIHRYMGPVS